MSYYNQQPPVGAPPQQGYPWKDAYQPPGYPPPEQGYPQQGYPPPYAQPPPPQQKQQRAADLPPWMDVWTPPSEEEDGLTFDWS